MKFSKATITTVAILFTSSISAKSLLAVSDSHLNSNSIVDIDIPRYFKRSDSNLLPRHDNDHDNDNDHDHDHKQNTHDDNEEVEDQEENADVFDYNVSEEEEEKENQVTNNNNNGKQSENQSSPENSPSSHDQTSSIDNNNNNNNGQSQSQDMTNDDKKKTMGHMSSDHDTTDMQMKPSPASMHGGHHHWKNILDNPDLEPQQRAYWEQYNTTTFLNANIPNKFFLRSHITLSILAWVFMYPVSVLISTIPTTSLYLPIQTLQTATNALSLFCLAIFGATAPHDLYPNNAYSKFSIVLFFISLVHWFAAVVKALANWAVSSRSTPMDGAEYVLANLNPTSHRGHFIRPSQDSGHGMSGSSSGDDDDDEEDDDDVNGVNDGIISSRNANNSHRALGRNQSGSGSNNRDSIDGLITPSSTHHKHSPYQDDDEDDEDDDMALYGGDSSSVPLNGASGSGSGSSSSAAAAAMLGGNSSSSTPNAFETSKAHQNRLIARVMSNQRVYSVVDKFGFVARIFYTILNRPLFVVGYAYLLMGSATLFRLGMGSRVFNILAHLIKGSVFFLYGILTLGRYLGAFSEYGMAWNIAPGSIHDPSHTLKKKKSLQMQALNKEFYGSSTPGVATRNNNRGILFKMGDAIAGMFRNTTMEFIECFLIFFYGSTNVFLEHLGNTDGKWSHKDLQHVSIAFMYLGGGLCGLIMESQGIRRLVNRLISTSKDDNEDDENSGRLGHISINPIPAFIVFWTGVLMSQHEQAFPLSTMIHMQWGYMFCIGSLFRFGTYIIIFFKPPTSTVPSRPITEVITAFALLCGGLVFMQSNGETVEALLYRNLDSMFTLNVNVGVTALIMSWIMLAWAFKSWVASRQRPRFLSDSITV